MERNILEEYIDACEVIKDIEKEIKKLKAKKMITANETVSGSNPEYPYNPQHFKVQGTIYTYGQSINPGCPEFYLVVRNFGNSAAVITEFEYEPDLSSCFGVSNCRNFLDDLQNASLAPGQSRICKLKYSLVPDYVTFKIEYNSGVKKYSETFSCNIKAGTSMLTGKIDTTGKELRTISYTLQEMLQKNL